MGTPGSGVGPGKNAVNDFDIALDGCHNLLVLTAVRRGSTLFRKTKYCRHRSASQADKFLSSQSGSLEGSMMSATAFSPESSLSLSLSLSA